MPRGNVPTHPHNDWLFVLGGANTDDLGAWQASASDILNNGFACSIVLLDDIGVGLPRADVTPLLPPVI